MNIIPSDNKYFLSSKVTKQSTRTKNRLIFTFAFLIAISILIIYKYNYWDHENPRFMTALVLANKNTTIYYRSLYSGKGNYFLQLTYGKPNARFANTQLEDLNQKDLYTIFYNTGCPNGYTHRHLLKEIVLSIESCHTANLYRCSEYYMDSTKSKKLQDSLPVLVYINEGEWMGRSEANIEPHSTILNLACRGMIILSINYRMGFYGYFSLNTTDTRGNQALEDIRVALEWTQKNVEMFGGDPNQITVMAKGIGAQLTSILSNHIETKKLFHKLILLSGSSYTPSLYADSYSNPYDTSMEFAVAAKCATEQQRQSFKNLSIAEISAIETCVRSISVENVQLIEKNLNSPKFIRWPLMSNEIENHSYQQLFKNLKMPSKIPIILGSCHRRNLKIKKNVILKEFSDSLKDQLNFVQDLNQLQYSNKIINFYLEELQDGRLGSPNQTIEKIIEKIKYDFIERGPLILEAYQREISQNGSENEGRIYFFDYEVPNNLLRQNIDTASHLEEENFLGVSNDSSRQLPCIDDMILNTLNGLVSKEHQYLITKILDYFVDFIIDGKLENSEMKWPSFSPSKNSMNVLHLNEKNIEIINYGEEISMKNQRFWLCEMAKNLNLSKNLC